MSAAQPQNPKGPRRAAKKRNKNLNPEDGQPWAAISDNEASLMHEQAQAQAHTDQNQARRKSHAHNKPQHSGNMSDNPIPAKAQATPIKSAYAGPMFHHSPAASALPMPSFYSKSVPASQPAPIVEDDRGVDETAADPGTPTKREGTPIDWLLDVARKQQQTLREGSPAALQGPHSVPSRSPAARSPAPRDGESMFAIELDGAATPGEDGKPFAPSYKDRINSAKSTRSSSASGVRELNDDERKIKAEDLKRLLFSSPQKTPQQHDPSNPFHAREAQSRPYTAQPQTTHLPNNQINQYPGNMVRPTSREQYLGSQLARPSSHLRYEATSEPEPAELSSDSGVTPPRSTARRHPNDVASPPPMPYHAAYSNGPANPHMQANYTQQYGFPSINPNPSMNHARGVPPPTSPPAVMPYRTNANNFNGPSYNVHPGHYAPPPMPAYPQSPPPMPAANGHRSQKSAAQMETDLWSVLNVKDLNLNGKG